MRFTLTLLTLFALNSTAFAMGDKQQAIAAPVDEVSISDTYPVLSAAEPAAMSSVKVETDTAPVTSAKSIECTHVCGDICVSRETAMVSKFACRDDALEACYRVNGTCGIINGKCGWVNETELGKCHASQ